MIDTYKENLHDMLMKEVIYPEKFSSLLLAYNIFSHLHSFFLRDNDQYCVGIIVLLVLSLGIHIMEKFTLTYVK